MAIMIYFRDEDDVVSREVAALSDLGKVAGIVKVCVEGFHFYRNEIAWDPHEEKWENPTPCDGVCQKSLFREVTHRQLNLNEERALASAKKQADTEGW
jgi:hypothetical protein